MREGVKITIAFVSCWKVDILKNKDQSMIGKHLKIGLRCAVVLNCVLGLRALNRLCLCTNSKVDLWFYAPSLNCRHPISGNCEGLLLGTSTDNRSQFLLNIAQE